MYGIWLSKRFPIQQVKCVSYIVNFSPNHTACCNRHCTLTVWFCNCTLAGWHLPAFKSIMNFWVFFGIWIKMTHITTFAICKAIECFTFQVCISSYNIWLIFITFKKIVLNFPNIKCIKTIRMYRIYNPINFQLSLTLK